MTTLGIRHLAAIAAVVAGLALPAGAAAAPGCKGTHWVGAWATSPSNSGPSFEDQTLRLIVTPTRGGERARVRLSNRLGSGAVTFSSAFLARRRAGASVAPGTSRRLRFAGRGAVTIQPGREVVSDPVSLRFRAFRDLAVSVHVRGLAEGASQHFLALQTSYSSVRGSGDHAGESSGTAFGERLGSWPYLTDVEVTAPRRVGAVVALGDSITEGFPGPSDANTRYTDFLARRLHRTAVQNAGISSNRLVGDFPRPFAGPSILQRLRRDAIDQVGATHVIVMAGTNDIGQPAPPSPATVSEVLAATRTLVRRLHRAGLRVVLGTQAPAKGSTGSIHGSQAAIAKRNRLNAWIRRQRIADGVVDFHAALRDPSDPDRLRPTFDSGDHLHPSAAGYRAMARAVPRRLLAVRCRAG